MEWKLLKATYIDSQFSTKDDLEGPLLGLDKEHVREVLVANGVVEIKAPVEERVAKDNPEHAAHWVRMYVYRTKRDLIAECSHEPLPRT